MNLAQQLQQLYSQFGDIEGINIELHKDLIAIAVNNKAAKALVFIQGAQVAQFQAHDQSHTLWLSDSNNYQSNKALRGGIPISWPWFASLADNPTAITEQFQLSTAELAELPPHGFVRNTSWQLDSISASSDQLTQLQLSLELEAGQHKYWPYACQLQLSISIGKELGLCLSVKNTGTQSFSYSSAMHSYFSVADIDRAYVTGLQGQRYLDKTDGVYKIEGDSISFNKETDRVYQRQQNESLADNKQTVCVIDKQQQKQIHISSEGSNSTVVWNPWIQKSKQLSHFKQQDYKKMLCVETANVGEDFVSLAPQQEKRLSLTIKPSIN